ncbi:hypothetical protein [Streptomyces sp. NPDC088196]|uniref:hypothetical protein n=1 Tax=Streptomyces sp. NPDC088196 TaxID=3154868 RepID=UPI00344E3C50
MARHQVQETTVHAYDAETILGASQPLPDEAALDGVDEFLSTRCAGTGPLAARARRRRIPRDRGPSRRLSLSTDGARVTGTADALDAAGATFRARPACSSWSATAVSRSTPRRRTAIHVSSACSWPGT